MPRRSMKLKPHRNSLFAILLRSRWWVSWLVAAGVFGLGRLALPDAVAAFAVLPFLVIGVAALWKQLTAPHGARVEAELERIRALSWEAFAAALEGGFAREGYAVKRRDGGADFELEKDGRTVLAAARRWKAQVTGLEPLKDLRAAAGKRGAAECLYLAAGEVTAKARGYARDNGVRVVEGPELVKLAG